ncbi:MAG TPA: hypothetical protein VI318_26290 [Baekduia sp.]
MNLTSVRGRYRWAGAVLAALALVLPVSSASAATFPSWWPTGSAQGAGVAAGLQGLGCDQANSEPEAGVAGGVENHVCGGVTITFIGPAIGQIGTAIGPTIIGATVLAPIAVSNGGVQQVAVP